MRPSVIFWTSSLRFSAFVAGACEPISIPIRNVTITDGGYVQWGPEIKLGTPSQTLCPAVDADWNNTVVWNGKPPCRDPLRPWANEVICSWFQGGPFKPSFSETWEPHNTTDNNERGGGDFDARSWGSDVMTFGQDDKMEGFPLLTPVGRLLPQGTIGIGRRSTLLEELTRQNKIPSRSWSMFWGRQGAEESQQMEGNLVLGGYDKAKTTSTNFTTPLRKTGPCISRMVVPVSNLILSDVNGKEVDLLESADGPMDACVSSGQPLLTFTETVLKKLKETLPGEFLGSSLGIIDGALDYKPEDVWTGNLTYTLASGLSITIPNHQLVLPNVGLDDDGNQVILSNSKNIPVWNKNEMRMPKLGAVFFSAAYIHVDYKLDQFTLWQANPTTNTDLVPVVHNPAACSDSETPSPTPAGNERNGSSGGGASSLSGGAIAGIAVGSSAGVAAILVAAFLIWRRRRRSKAETDSKNPVGANSTNPTHQVHAELPQPYAELPLPRWPRQELAGDTPGVDTHPGEVASRPSP